MEVVETGEAALGLLTGEAAQPFDVVVLDVMLPGKDGFEVMSEMRQAGQYMPTLMLTARGHPQDVLQGFAAGADDYLVKAVRTRNPDGANSGLAAAKRVAAKFSRKINSGTQRHLCIWRQVRLLRPAAVTSTRSGLSPDADGNERSEAPDYACRPAGLAREHARRGLGLREDTDTRALDNFIVRLRRYIEEDPSKPRHLLTVRGVGYRFVAFPQGENPAAGTQ